ncbi:MAG: guanylate kinase [Desulfocapsa sp.]|nr:MAG: guanylate kinase [Desulfocapsa sp.]
MHPAGQLYILSAPSGCGKTTILKEVMASIPGLAFSVSHTTRDPRSGEKNGAAYHFVNRDEFRKMRDDEHFIEWAEVHGNFYGTSRQAVADQLENGQDVILDIDVQGAAIVNSDPDFDPVSIFVAPPTLSELERRLHGRGTDSDETIVLRLKNAAKEMAAVSQYQYLVINDRLDDAVLVMQSIIIARRSRVGRLPDGTAISLETVK